MLDSSFVGSNPSCWTKEVSSQFPHKMMENPAKVNLFLLRIKTPLGHITDAEHSETD